MWNQSSELKCSGDEKSELVYLKSKTGAEKTEPWEKNTVGDVDVLKNNKITQMLLFKNIWNSFDAVYAIGNDKDLIIMWTEAEADKPGDWLKTEEVILNYFYRESRRVKEYVFEQD